MLAVMFWSSLMKGRGLVLEVRGTPGLETLFHVGLEMENAQVSCTHLFARAERSMGFAAWAWTSQYTSRGIVTACQGRLANHIMQSEDIRERYVFMQ